MSYEWTPQSGYWTPFGLWDAAERLLFSGRRGAPIGDEARIFSDEL